MTKKNQHLLANFLRRDLTTTNEGRLSYIQIFGFILIMLGIIYLVLFLLRNGINHFFPKFEFDVSANTISIAFFITMLGIAFAFPQMLKGQTKDVSTMRIIVFMFANVICMLLLNIGWGKQSLADKCVLASRYIFTDEKFHLTDIADTDKNKSTTVSSGGDSGSCVYHKQSGKMIGMLLGGNDTFSFVLPFEQTLKNNNFKLI